MNAPATLSSGGLGPVGDAERIDAIDVLRGFALFGILVVNIGFFAYPVSDPFHLPADASQTDHLVRWLTAAFAQGKFYPVFAFLFGLGFAIQLERAREHGGNFEYVYARRLLALFVIGLLHGIFIWAGDILAAYAVLGFILLVMGRATPRVLLSLALSAYGLQILLVVGFTLALSGLAADPAARQEMAAAMNDAAMLRADAWTAYGSGSYADITRVRTREFLASLQNTGSFGLQVLGMFLLGCWFARRGVPAHPLLHRRLLKSLLVLGLVAGIPLTAVFAELNATIDYHAHPTPLVGMVLLLNLVAGFLLAMAYIATIMLAMQTRAARRLRVLAPVGRTALSNYLLQSLICTLVFYPYGLGLFAALSQVQLAGVVLLVFAAQVVVSHWWVRRFRFGPMEWLWRGLAYLEWPPMRRTGEAVITGRAMRR